MHSMRMVVWMDCCRYKNKSNRNRAGFETALFVLDEIFIVGWVLQKACLHAFILKIVLKAFPSQTNQR